MKLAWEEAHERGPKWRKLMLDGMRHLAPRSRDVTLKIVGRPRGSVPQIDLTFSNPPVRYDFDRKVVKFVGESLGSPVECAVSREALDDHFGADNADPKGRLEAFQKNRSRIETLLRSKYLRWPFAEPEAVLLKTGDVEALSSLKS